MRSAACAVSYTVNTNPKSVTGTLRGVDAAQIIP
jgi:hypothetical protein